MERSSSFFPWSVDEALERLGVAKSSKDANVISFFILGSRLWGTDNSNSDWDLLIVVDTLPRSSEKGFLSIHHGNLDALVITKQLYLQRIEEGSFLEVITCFLKNTKFSLLDHLSPKCTTPKPVFIDHVTKTLKRDWDMAKKYLDKGNLPRAKKTLVHTARVILITDQIIKHGKVIDFTVANEYYYNLLYCEETNWSHYEKSFGPTLKQLFQQLKQ
eukprot:TRINITY_DN23352_c0_g1_i1.p1 TRINITY_DN23352_c0_g1~~TRINITY_DN23352_c0_g1_i1.p1  ORF type:complete len:216 (-),score=46.60 TRINITY_DN23352_c0_g1_i1:120-767(-)